MILAQWVILMFAIWENINTIAVIEWKNTINAQFLPENC